jgi:hypothetical protein
MIVPRFEPARITALATIGDAMTRPSRDNFADLALSKLRIAGMPDAEPHLWSATGNGFGDSLATFRVDSFLLRLLRDRGQFFVEVAATAFPDVFHALDDVDVLLGFTTISAVLSKQSPEDIDAALARIARNRPVYSAAFDANSVTKTSAQLARIARERGELFVKKLHGAQD